MLIGRGLNKIEPPLETHHIQPAGDNAEDANQGREKDRSIAQRVYAHSREHCGYLSGMIMFGNVSADVHAATVSGKSCCETQGPNDLAHL